MTNEQRIRYLCIALGISGDNYRFLADSYRAAVSLGYSETESYDHVARMADEIGRIPAMMRRQAG